MDTLKLLEDKIIILVSLIKDVKQTNSTLQATIQAQQEYLDELSGTNKDLLKENARLTEENFQLLHGLEGLEGSVLTGTIAIEKLNEEKALTKLVVDDLIKSINDLVETETQQ